MTFYIPTSFRTAVSEEGKMRDVAKYIRRLVLTDIVTVCSNQVQLAEMLKEEVDQ